MDSLAKCGNGYGYGYGYGYGNSKPQMNYHRQNSESVTTVVTEINRMTVNDKPAACYGVGGDVQKQACKVEKFDEHDEAYNGAVAVQKHSFKEEKEEKYGAAAVKKHEEYKTEEKYGEVIDAEYGAHYGGGGAAVNKQGYNYKQEAYGETGYGGAHYGGGADVKKQAGYNYTQEACGETYGGHHGGAGAGAQTYAYDQQAAYGGAIGAAVQQQAYKHKDAAYYGGAAGKTNGYQEKMYGYGEAAAVDAAGAGYGAHYGGGAVQQHGYQKDAYGYGAAGGKVNKNRYQYQEAYGGTDAGGYGGAHCGGGAGAGAVQQYGYPKAAYGYGAAAAAGGKVVKSGGYGQYQEAYGGTGAGGYGGAHYGGGVAAAQNHGHGYMQGVYESDTESESDESDCEEAFPPRGGMMQQGGVQHSYGAYKHGAGNLGGVRRYESYESREELGGGGRYETYKSTVQYTGGGAGGYATCSPVKNPHLLRYGA